MAGKWVVELLIFLYKKFRILSAQSNIHINQSISQKKNEEPSAKYLKFVKIGEGLGKVIRETEKNRPRFLYLVHNYDYYDFLL